MKLLQMISPWSPPAHIAEKSDLDIIRERILQTLLVVVAIASLLGIVVLAIVYSQKQMIQELVNYTLFTMLILGFVAFRRMPYVLRSGIVLLTILGSSVLAFWDNGLEGNGKLYLFTFTALTTILLGWRAGVGAMVLTEISLVIAGYLFVNLMVPIPAGAALLNSISGNSWTDTIVFYGILASVITFSLSMLLNSMETSYFRVDRLSKDLTKERSSLQEKVELRTEEIQYRLRQVLTASEISKTIVAFRETEQLLPKIVDLIHDRFELYYVGVFIVDANDIAVLKAGSGLAGQQMLAAGHQLPVGGSSMIGWSIANRQARIALDVGTEAVRFNNPNLPNTRSELAIPIISRNIGLGALTIQSDQPNAFDENDIQILQGIADSLAIALENSQLYQQAQESLDEVRILNREYLQQAWSRVTDEYADLSYNYENQEVAPITQTNVIEIPLILREQVIGQITLETESSSLSPDQLELIDAITTQTSLALENARLLDETQHRSFQEQTLNRLTSEFSRAFSVDDILKTALRQLSLLPMVNDISVHLVSPNVSSTVGGDPSIDRYSRGNGRENN